MQQKLSHRRSHKSPSQNPSQSYHHYTCKTQVKSMYLQLKNLHWYKPLPVLAILWYFPVRKKKRKKMLINFFSLRTIFPFTKETAVSGKDILYCKELEILGSSKGNSRERENVCVRKRGWGREEVLLSSADFSKSSHHANFFLNTTGLPQPTLSILASQIPLHPSSQISLFSLASIL